MKKLIYLAILGLFINAESFAYRCENYKIKNGDTIDKILYKFHIKKSSLIGANPFLKKEKFLRVGKELCIPVKESKRAKAVYSKKENYFGYKTYTIKRGGTLKDVALATGVPLSKLIRLNPELKGKYLKEGTIVKIGKKEIPTFTYRVKEGDTLSGLSYKFKVSKDEIRALNNLKDDTLVAGEEIKLPLRAKQIPPKKENYFGYKTYTIKRGGTLKDVALATGVPLSKLIRLNPELKGKYLKEGTIVKIGKKEIPTFTYRVKEGDTLSGLSYKFKVSKDEIRALNNLKDDTLVAGEEIKLPLRAKEYAKQKSNKEIREKTYTKNQENITHEEVASIPSIPQKESIETGSYDLPVNGKIEKSERGINILAPCGDSVKSITGGKVVYAGNDLASYGYMVIVDSGKLISVYAYNQKINVRKGQTVSPGEKIAEVGQKPGTDICELHFELRSKDGTPLDPLSYLKR